MHIFRSDWSLPMKSLIDHERVLDAFKERTRKNLGNRKLAVMEEADLESLVDTVVISNSGGGMDDNSASASTPMPRGRTARSAFRK